MTMKTKGPGWGSETAIDKGQQGGFLVVGGW